jgi:hypothetical protein
MEANVDLYLDWYYSLEGEYGRIGNMLVGDLHGYMLEQFRHTLQRGAPSERSSRGWGPC